MSLTLGEKLRQAREERGISISEVAEQTRISPHYLESIERDDYKPLPGGIFNRGFVKSYAKYVDIDESEALADYASLISTNQSTEEPSLKVYRPEVLTDDRSGSSMIPTIIIALVMLGLMTGGILFVLNYWKNQPAAGTQSAPANANANTATSNNNNAAGTPAGVPDMATLKVDFKALSEAVSLSATVDGKFTNTLVAAGTSVPFEPKESLKLSYHRSKANLVQLTINGKTITLPAQPGQAKKSSIEIEITKANLSQIWQSGVYSADVPGAVTDPNAVPAPSTSGPATPSGPKPTATAKPATAANTKPVASPAKTPAPSAKPATTPKPTGNRPQ